MSKVEGVTFRFSELKFTEYFSLSKRVSYTQMSLNMSGQLKFVVHYGDNSDCESKTLASDVASCGCNVSLFFGYWILDTGTVEVRQELF